MSITNGQQLNTTPLDFAVAAADPDSIWHELAKTIQNVVEDTDKETLWDLCNRDDVSSTNGDIRKLREWLKLLLYEVFSTDAALVYCPYRFRGLAHRVEGRLLVKHTRMLTASPSVSNLFELLNGRNFAGPVHLDPDYINGYGELRSGFELFGYNSKPSQDSR